MNIQMDKIRTAKYMGKGIELTCPLQACHTLPTTQKLPKPET